MYRKFKWKNAFAAVPFIEHGVLKAIKNGTRRIVTFLFSFVLSAKNPNGSPNISL